jgi:hypothetical protein
MMIENLGKTLVNEKYSKKRITKCKEGHCTVTTVPSKQ